MERTKDKGWKGTQATAACLHRMPEEKDTLLRREACLQALPSITDTMRL
jgi:hypothetical protein